MKLIFLIFFSSYSFTTYAVEETLKYGIVDMQMVILSVEEGKKARQKLEKEIKKKEKVLLKSKQELDNLNKEWQSQAPLLSESAKLKKQQEFQQKFVSLRNSEMEFQAEIKRKEQQATKGIALKVSKLVEKIAKQEKLDAVFETNNAGLIYVKNPVNLTNKVIDRYNKTHKVTKKK